MPFGSLWLPVLVSTVVVFVASSILHMVLKYHKADYKGLPDEESARAALGKTDPAPGIYLIPYCPDMKQMKEPAMREKFEKGPVAFLTIRAKGFPGMGQYLGLWFVFCGLVSFAAASVARHTLHPGDDGMLVLRVAATVAFAAYGLAPISNSIWKGEPWSNTARAILDGAIYAVLTGLTFRLLWPAA
jgi:hypothetical protein